MTPVLLMRITLYIVLSIKQTFYASFLFLFCLQIKKRFIVNMPAFKLRVVNKDGVQELPTLKPQALDF